MAREYLIRAVYISESKLNVNSTEGNSDISIVNKIDIIKKFTKAVFSIKNAKKLRKQFT